MTRHDRILGRGSRGRPVAPPVDPGHAWFVLSVAFCVAVSVAVLGDPVVFRGASAVRVRCSLDWRDSLSRATATTTSATSSTGSNASEDGEDVDFESDREDEVGRLYDAVGSLAERAGNGDRRGEAHQRELERQASLLNSLFERLPVSLYVKDREGDTSARVPPTIASSIPATRSGSSGRRTRDLRQRTRSGDPRRRPSRDRGGESIVEKVEFDPADEEWLLTSKVPWRDGTATSGVSSASHVRHRAEGARGGAARDETETRTRTGRDENGIYDWNLETDEVDWSETFERMLGIEPGTFEGTYDAFERRVHPDDVSRIDAAVDRALENDELFLAEFRLRHEDGRWIWVNARGRVVFDEGGHRRMVGINHDITERKQREQQLQRYRGTPTTCSTRSTTCSTCSTRTATSSGGTRAWGGDRLHGRRADGEAGAGVLLGERRGRCLGRDRGGCSRRVTPASK